MKSFITISIMLVVMPIVSSAVIIIVMPNNLGDQPLWQKILMLSVYGLATVPMWITYVPSIVLTPIAMGKLAADNSFYTIPLFKFISISVIAGMLMGILIFSPIIIMKLPSLKEMLCWVWVATISGSVTFTIISLLYRFKGPA